jgi:hypothetical protein
MAETPIANPSPAPTSPRGALALLGSAAAAGAIIVFGAVLPAEYGRDPLGLGKLTGVAALHAPEEKRVAASAGSAVAARSYPGAFRSDVIEVPLDTYESGRPSELEYKVRLRKGATLIYSWEAPGVTDPESFYSEFHGHTLVSGGQGAMTVAEYRKASGFGDNGALVAPFDGIHGWYFQNSTAHPVTVRIRLSGFYELIPAGQPGNEAGIAPAQP